MMHSHQDDVHHHHLRHDPEHVFSKKQRLVDSDHVDVPYQEYSVLNKPEELPLDLHSKSSVSHLPFGMEVDPSHISVTHVEHLGMGGMHLDAQIAALNSPVLAQMATPILPTAIYHHPPMGVIAKPPKRKRSALGDLQSSGGIAKEMKGKFSQEESNTVRHVVEEAFKARGKDPRKDFAESMHKQKKEEFKDIWSEVAAHISGRDKHQIIRHAQILFGKPSGKIDWTDALVKRLLQLCEEHNNQWYKIAEEINIPATQCRDKWRILQRSTTKKHLQQQQQAMELPIHLHEHDVGDQLIASMPSAEEIMPAMEVKRPKSTWTEDELTRLKHLIKKHAANNDGPKLPWVAISREHGTKDDHQCESKFRRLIPKCESTKSAVAYVSDVEWPESNDFALLVHLKKEQFNFESEIDFALMANFISQHQKLTHPEYPERMAVEARMAWQAMKNIVGLSNRKPLQDLLRDLADHYKLLKEFDES